MSLFLTDYAHGFFGILFCSIFIFVMVKVMFYFGDMLEEIEENHRSDLEKELEAELNKMLSQETDHY